MDDLIHSPWDCPDPTGDHCEDARRRAIVRAGVRIPGLTPKNEASDAEPMGDWTTRVQAGEPVPLVEQSNRREGVYLGSGS